VFCHTKANSQKSVGNITPTASLRQLRSDDAEDPELSPLGSPSHNEFSGGFASIADRDMSPNPKHTPNKPDNNHPHSPNNDNESSQLSHREDSTFLPGNNPDLSQIQSSSTHTPNNPTPKEMKRQDSNGMEVIEESGRNSAETNENNTNNSRNPSVQDRISIETGDMDESNNHNNTATTSTTTTRTTTTGHKGSLPRESMLTEGGAHSPHKAVFNPFSSSS